MRFGKNPQKERLKRRDGFTLIEIVMVIVMVAIMGTFTIQYLWTYTKAAQDVSERKDIVDQLTLSMEWLTRELRLAECTTPAPVIAGNRITFDKTSGYPVDPDTTAIRYRRFGGSQLFRRRGTVQDTLAENVTAFAVSTTVADPTLYNITITASTPNGGTFTITSSVRPRDCIP